MSDWHNLAWYQKEWVAVAGTIVMAVCLVAAVVWFIDGIRKYAYWWKKDDEE